jgi:hypothetical protein
VATETVVGLIVKYAILPQFHNENWNVSTPPPPFPFFVEFSNTIFYVEPFIGAGVVWRVHADGQNSLSRHFAPFRISPKFVRKRG